MAEHIPGNRIREFRKQKKLTLQELADAIAARGRVAMHPTTLTKLENRQRTLTDKTLAEIAAALEVDPADLLMTEEEPTLVMAPLIRWRDLLSVAVGDPLDGKVDRIPVMTTSAKVIAVRLPNDVTMVVDSDLGTYVGIADLDDREIRDGWWIGGVASEITLLRREDGIWQDYMGEGEPFVREGAVRPLIGRFTEFRISLEMEEAKIVDDDDDLYIVQPKPDKMASQDPNYNVAFTRKAKRK